MDEELLSSVPSHSCALFFLILPPPFIPPLYLLLLLPFFIIICVTLPAEQISLAMLLHLSPYVLWYSFPWVPLSSILQDQWFHQSNAPRNDVPKVLADVLYWTTVVSTEIIRTEYWDSDWWTWNILRSLLQDVQKNMWQY